MVAQCFTHFATAANYVCEGINYPSEKNDQKNIEKYNLTTALNILYAKQEKKLSWLRFKTTHIVKNNSFF